MLGFISFTLLLVVSYVMGLGIASQDGMSALNQIGPIALLAMCLFGAYRSLTRARYSLFTPLPWFYLSCAAYFGIGPLVYPFGTSESVEYCDQFFKVNELSLLRTNLLNSVGILFILLGFRLTQLLNSKGKTTQENPDRPAATRNAIFLFLAIGLFVKYVFTFPYYMGWITWTLPGSIQYLSTLSRFAIILLFVQKQKGSPRWRWILYALIAEELTLSLMTLSKLAVIEVIIAIGLGWIITSRPNLKKLITSGVVLALTYVFILSPFVSYARLFAGSVGVGSVAEIGESISSYATASNREDLAEVSSGVQAWWTRLSYSNAQTFAMVDYDAGHGGQTLALSLYAFLPRLLYPDKPIMTPGREFTAAITGVDTETATAAGLFAEAYWNGGWTMVIVISLIIGALFNAFTIFANRKLASKEFEYIPIMMIGISLGYSPCDWFASTYVGPLANAITLYFVIKLIVTPKRYNASATQKSTANTFQRTSLG